MGASVCLLVRPSARLVPFVPTLVAFGLGLLVAVLADPHAPAAAQLPRMRGVAILFAVAVTFAFDEAVADVADATPVPRVVRAAVRATVQILPAIMMWSLLLALVSARNAEPLPAGLLSLEAAGMVMVGWAIAAWWRRARGETYGGVVAAPALIVLVLIAHRLPPGSRCSGCLPTRSCPMRCDGLRCSQWPSRPSVWRCATRCLPFAGETASADLPATATVRTRRGRAGLSVERDVPGNPRESDCCSPVGT